MKTIYAFFFLSLSVIALLGEEQKSQTEENKAQDEPVVKLMTLYDALTGAYTHDLNQAAREQVHAEHERLVQAKADFLPTLSLQGQYQDDNSKNSGVNGSTSPNTRNESASLVFNQNLSNGGASFCKLDEANARIKKSWMDTLQKTEQSVFKDAANSFFDVLSAIKAIKVAKANLDFLQKQFESMNEKHKVGEETITNVKAAEAGYYKGKADYDASIANLESLKADFKFKTTLNSPNDFEKPVLASFMPTTIDIAIDIALMNHYAIKSAQCDVDVATAQAGQAKGGLLPKIDFQAKGSKQKQDRWGDLGIMGQPGVSNTNDFQFTVTASVPIYEAGAVRSQIRQAYKQKTAAEISLQNVKRQITSAVKSAWINLKSLESQVSALEKVVSASKLAVDGLTEEQKAGTKTILDVLQEQNKYFNYQKQLIDAERDYLKGCVTLLFTMGVFNHEKLSLKVITYDPSKDLEDAKGRF
jgi:outer membrane protein